MPVDLGQVQIQQHEVWSIRVEQVQCLHAVASFKGAVTGDAKRERVQPSEVLAVLDDEVLSSAWTQLVLVMELFLPRQDHASLREG